MKIICKTSSLKISEAKKNKEFGRTYFRVGEFLIIQDGVCNECFDTLGECIYNIDTIVDCFREDTSMFDPSEYKDGGNWTIDLGEDMEFEIIEIVEG